MIPPAAALAECVILVPVGGAIEDALRELERRGHPVWRYRGYSTVDAAPNQMASDALGAGGAELMWIDADVVFEPDRVDRLRAHDRPFTCGLYPKKGRASSRARSCSCRAHPRSGSEHGAVWSRSGTAGSLPCARTCSSRSTTSSSCPCATGASARPWYPFFQPLVVGEPSGP
ncbi:hypothetical protein [Gemmata massiliana]|uniref:hypothetical protein n=1 Tax=Gemmata massiliana TaxID=1210884 RepID=UPI0013A6E485|nr:hypothetical protein [Gemmata massiliana]